MDDYKFFEEHWNIKFTSAATQDASDVGVPTVANTGAGPNDCNEPPTKSRRVAMRNDDRVVATSSDDWIGMAMMDNIDFPHATTTTTKKPSGSSSRVVRNPNHRSTSSHCFAFSEIDELIGWATSYGVFFGKDSQLATRQEEPLGLLAHLPVAPPPPSHLAYLHRRISDRYSTAAKINMDSSAYVAIGMAVEEALTMALMPLAEAHVDRCRRLEREESSKCRETTHLLWSKGLDPYHEWTLPPGEAIAELASNGQNVHALAPLLDRYYKSRTTDDACAT